MSDKTPKGGIDRVGIGTDLHRLAAGRRLVLGHVPIPFDRGLVGHSDGDVVLHAIIDALAGAAGLPDIGEMFPDTDAAYKGADSAVLLEKVRQRVAGKGLAVVNVDIIVQAEQPKLGSHKTAMRDEIAWLLDVPADAVSVKAKTNEGLGAIGGGEAIACTAVVGLRMTA